MSNKIQGYIQFKPKKAPLLDARVESLELPQKKGDLLLFKCTKCGFHVQDCQCPIEIKSNWHTRIYRVIKKTIKSLSQRYFKRLDKNLAEIGAKILIKEPEQTEIQILCPEDFYSLETLEQLQEVYRNKAKHFLEKFHFYDKKCAELDKKIAHIELKNYREAIN